MKSREQQYTQTDTKNEDIKENTPKNLENKSEMNFVEKHKQLFDNFLGGSFEVEQSKEGTFYFDLKRNVVGVSDMFYKDKNFEWQDEATVFATLHELGHFEEKFQMLNEKKGEVTFKKYLDRIKKDRAFAVLDNCVADNRENKNVISKTNTNFKEIERKMYQEVAFKETDFTDKPRHVQLSYALIREGRLPDEKCNVAPEVRQALDRIFGVKTKLGNSMFELMTNPNMPMSKRLALQDVIIVPEMEKLKDKDLEDKKEKKDKSQQNGEKNDEQNENQNKEESDNSKESDPNEIFKDYYDELEKKLGEQMSPKNMEKMLDDYKKISKEEKTKNPKNDAIQKANEEYAKKLGVLPEDLKNYRDLARKINDLKNPKTGELLVDEMENLFRKIISKREKSTWLPKVPSEEGEYLIDPASAIAEVKRGNFEPKVWESVELKEKKSENFGEVEITLVCDCSGSMKGERQKEQLNATILLMETIKRFVDMIDEDRDNLTNDLKISSEIYSFGRYGKNFKPLKTMSDDFTEKERIEATKIVSKTDGPDNNEHEVFERIEENISDETKEKISGGELKKILIIFSDGIADDVNAVKSQIAKIRQDGVITIGVGITDDGRSALETYAPNARLAKNVSDICPILADLLKEHLKDI